MKHLLLALVCLLFILPVMAQDETPVATLDPTVEGPVVVNIEQPPAPVEQTSIIQTVLSHVLAFIVGGGVVLAVASGWIRSAMNDPVKMMLAEKLGDSVPLETVSQLTGFLDAAKAFVIEATDRTPAITKPPAASSGFTSTPTQNLP